MKHIGIEEMEKLAKGNPSLEERLIYMEHIAQCTACSNQFAEYMSKETLAVPPSDFKETVLKRIDKLQKAENTGKKRKRTREEKRRELFRYSLRVGFAVAASIFLVLSANEIVAKQPFSQRERNSTVSEVMAGRGEKESKITAELQKGSRRWGDMLDDWLPKLSDLNKKGK